MSAAQDLEAARSSLAAAQQGADEAAREAATAASSLTAAETAYGDAPSSKTADAATKARSLADLARLRADGARRRVKEALDGLDLAEVAHARADLDAALVTASRAHLLAELSPLVAELAANGLEPLADMLTATSAASFADALDARAAWTRVDQLIRYRARAAFRAQQAAVDLALASASRLGIEPPPVRAVRFLVFDALLAVELHVARFGAYRVNTNALTWIAGAVYSAEYGDAASVGDTARVISFWRKAMGDHRADFTPIVRASIEIGDWTDPRVASLAGLSPSGEAEA